LARRPGTQIRAIFRANVNRLRAKLFAKITALILRALIPTARSQEMGTLRRINLSAAIIALICFFLPWEQVSCAGEKDTLSGLDLARHGQGLLWFVLILIAAVVLLGAVRAWRDAPKVFSVIDAAGGVIAAYLMNRERMRVHNESDLIAAQLTGWFWLGFWSALAVAISALVMLLRRRRAP
jgi:hypothetical protein